MQDLTLPTPVLVDVVPFEQADTLIRSVQQDLIDLHHRVEDAEQRADATERRVRDVGADPVVIGRAVDSVHRSIDQRRQAIEAEVLNLTRAASMRAEDRVRRAREVSDHARPPARRAPMAPAEPGEPLWLDLTGRQAPASAPVPAKAGAPELHRDEAKDETPPSSDAPTFGEERVGNDPGAYLTDPNPAPNRTLQPLDPEAVLTPKLDAWVLEVPYPADVWGDPDQPDGDEPDNAEWWGDDATRVRPSRLGSVPMAALLQVAGLLVVLVVLLAFVG